MRLPAEWERQDGVQLTWPHCDTEWYELEKVLGCYVEIAYNILRFEKLIIDNIDISSQQLRKWIREGKSVRYYTPDSVIAYINEHQIYTT